RGSVVLRLSDQRPQARSRRSSLEAAALAARIADNCQERAGIPRQPHSAADDQRGFLRAGGGNANATEIDEGMTLGCNHPMRPLALADLIGLDVLLAVLQTLKEEFRDPEYRPCPLLRE